MCLGTGKTDKVNVKEYLSQSTYCNLKKLIKLSFCFSNLLAALRRDFERD